MEKDTIQLEIFDALRETTPQAPPPEPQGNGSACLCPSGGIRECQACWDNHPHLWARYVTRANCVRHNR